MLHAAWGFIVCSTSRCIQLGASSFAAPAVGSISYICVMHTAWGFIMAAPAICIAVTYLFVLLMSSPPCRVSLSHLYLYLSFSLHRSLIHTHIYMVQWLGALVSTGHLHRPCQTIGLGSGTGLNRAPAIAPSIVVILTTIIIVMSLLVHRSHFVSSSTSSAIAFPQH